MHLPRIPDLEPCNFFLVPKFNMALKSWFNIFTMTWTKSRDSPRIKQCASRSASNGGFIAGLAVWRSKDTTVTGTTLIARQVFVCFWRDSPQWARASSFTRVLDHTHRRTTVGRTPLDEWSARRRDLYLTTINTHNRQTSMPPVGLEPTFSAYERPQTYPLDRAATGTGARHVLRR